MKLEFLNEKEKKELGKFFGYYKTGNILYMQPLVRVIKSESLAVRVIERLLAEGFINEDKKELCSSCFGEHVVDGACEICDNKGTIEKTYYIILKEIIC